jgi:hypothetical protein
MSAGLRLRQGALSLGDLPEVFGEGALDGLCHCPSRVERDLRVRLELPVGKAVVVG